MGGTCEPMLHDVLKLISLHNHSLHLTNCVREALDEAIFTNQIVYALF